MSRCRACAHGDCEDCQTLGFGCECCNRDAPHDDPCDCSECRDAVEAAAELEFESLKAEGLS